MKLMGKNKAAAVAAAASLAAMLALAACSGSSTASSASSDAGASSEALTVSEQTVENPEPEILEIGKDGEGVLSITFANKLGAAITDIAVQPAESDADPAYLMEEGQEWAKGEDALVHFEDAGDVAYDVYLKAGKDEYVLHDLAIATVDDVTVRLEDGVAYATFKLDGSEVSSLSAEIELKEQAKAEAAAQAEAEAAEAEAAEEEAYYEESYDAPAQTEDSCIEGGVQLR